MQGNAQHTCKDENVIACNSLMYYSIVTLSSLPHQVARGPGDPDPLETVPPQHRQASHLVRGRAQHIPRPGAPAEGPVQVREGGLIISWVAGWLGGSGVRVS